MSFRLLTKWSGSPICTSFWAFLGPLRALKGPQIKFSHILMYRPYRDLQNLKFSCLYLFPFFAGLRAPLSRRFAFLAPSRARRNQAIRSLTKWSPKKRRVEGRGLWVGGRGSGLGVVYHTSTGQYIGVATFFFLFEPGVKLKLDKKSIENGLEGQKFLVVSFLGWLPQRQTTKKLKI